MKIVSDPSQLPARPGRRVMTIGAYDGVHLGHQAILKQVVSRAAEIEALAVLLTFSPHPQKVVSPGDAPPLLQTTAQRENMLRELGIDCLLEMPFTRRLSLFSPRDFAEKILAQAQAEEVHVGWNFRFGHRRRGDVEQLEALGSELGFRVFSVPPCRVGPVIVSSTGIRRHLLNDGNVSEARRMLGRAYCIEGTVVRGDRRGRQLGFPTVNLETRNELIPRNGVYAGCFFLDGQAWTCVSNVGYRPTVTPDYRGRPLVESHLLDFEGDLYGRHVRVEFLHRLRPEKKFGDLAALTRQIALDVVATRRYFRLLHRLGKRHVRQT